MRKGENQDEIMLNVISLNGQSNTSGAVMLLGGFDGLHIGHRALVSRAKEMGTPVGIMTIVGCKDQPLFTFQEREEIFHLAGVDFVFELPFDEIKNLSPKEFINLLEKEFLPAGYVCGDDFRFGFKAQGTPNLLKEYTRVRVEIVKLLKLNGEKISSTAIKTLLKNGEIEKANALLGEEFFLISKVKKDRQIGKTLGFPTANMLYPTDKFPLKEGVYQTWAEIDGKTYKGITNFGARPTFDNHDVCVETHFVGFDGDLYGKKIKLHFTRRMRDIQKFENVEQLKTQLEQDLQEICGNGEDDIQKNARNR